MKDSIVKLKSPLPLIVCVIISIAIMSGLKKNNVRMSLKDMKEYENCNVQHTERHEIENCYSKITKK